MSMLIDMANGVSPEEAFAGNPEIMTNPVVDPTIDTEGTLARLEAFANATTPEHMDTADPRQAEVLGVFVINAEGIQLDTGRPEFDVANAQAAIAEEVANDASAQKLDTLGFAAYMRDEYDVDTELTQARQDRQRWSTQQVAAEAARSEQLAALHAKEQRVAYEFHEAQKRTEDDEEDN